MLKMFLRLILKHAQRQWDCRKPVKLSDKVGRFDLPESASRPPPALQGINDPLRPPPGLSRATTVV